MATRYSLPKSGPGSRKFAMVMREFEAGTLHSGSGEVVTNPNQAKAIAASEADKLRRKGRKR